MKQEIDIEGLPEGWEAVTYRCPLKGEQYLHQNQLWKAFIDESYPFIVVEKIHPRRIVLEETGEIRRPEIGEYIQNNGNFCKCHKPERWGYEHEIWKEVKE